MFERKATATKRRTDRDYFKPLLTDHLIYFTVRGTCVAFAASKGTETSFELSGFSLTYFSLHLDNEVA